MNSKLILGTVQFGLNYGINNVYGRMPDTEIRQVLDLAYKAGIDHLDTAADYGDAEKKIGKLSAQEYKFKIISKFSKKPGIDWKASLKQSLADLKTPKLDTVMFHSFEAYEQAKPYITEIISEGKNKLFDKLGVSVYTNEELNKLVDDEYIHTVQCPFNMLDNHFQRSESLKKLKNAGKTIHTRSVFLQGLLLMDLDNIPARLSPLYSACLQIRSIASENHLSIGHLALQYALSKDYIDGVLIGVDAPGQLKTNMEWSLKPVPQTILSAIDEIPVTETSLLNPSKW